MPRSRQIAVIMFTDIVGYTTIMGEDEARALEILSQNKKIHQRLLRQFNGNYLKEMGDGVLASFQNVTDAVYCAGTLLKETAGLKELNLRIGLHLGEVVVDGKELYGDGVNIASRIEGIAEGGQLLVSETIYKNIKNRAGIQTTFLGEHLLKNVDEPVRIYSIEVGKIPDSHAAEKKTSIVGEKAFFSKSIIIVFISLAIISLVYFLGFRSSTAMGNDEALEKSIAVLPFKDMTHEQDQAYLGDGIAEEIINVLTQIEELKVIGRTSSFSFKEKDDDLITIGQILGVGTILEGSVRKSNNQIRVTAQLINAKDGSHIWSDTYERELKDIFAIQDEISAIVVNKFKLTLDLLQEKSPPTSSIEAYEYYLKGLQSVHKGIVGAKTGIEFLEKAIAMDPGFLLAHMHLSEGYWALGLYGLVDHTESNKKSKEAALKIIEIDPNSYIGYNALAWVNFAIDWDWGAAMENHKKAVELGMPDISENYSYFQSAYYGGGEEPIRNIKKLLEEDPYSVNLLNDLSRMYLYARQFEGVIANGKRILELSPDNSSVRRHLGSAHLFTGDYPMALQYYGELLEKDSTYAPHGYIAALVKSERLKEARDLFDKLPEISSVKKAFCYVHLNQMDSVFHYLDKAFVERDDYMPFLKAEPHFDPIKNDPRYGALLKKMNLPVD